MRVHDLKTWPDPFQAVLDGRKRYEIRVDDRGFAVGDELLLREYQPNETGGREVVSTAITPWGFPNTTAHLTPVVPPHYTGRSLRVRVTYLTPGGAWGLPAGMCVMSIERISAQERDS